MMMSRKSLWFGLALAIAGAMLVFASANVNAQKRKRSERVSGPPSLSLAADPTLIKACNDESARVRLVATASSPDGAALRYKWTTSGGRLRGEGANTTWDLAEARAGVYQASLGADDRRALNCLAMSSV